MSTQFSALVSKLKEIFQINRPDLDFGVYRILNARSAEIAEFLDKRLKTKVEQYLGEAKSSLDENVLKEFSVHDKFHRTLILSGFCLLKIAKISLNSSFFPKPIKR